MDFAAGFASPSHRPGLPSSGAVPSSDHVGQRHVAHRASRNSKRVRATRAAASDPESVRLPASGSDDPWKHSRATPARVNAPWA